jgi:hypothetical protein
MAAQSTPTSIKSPPVPNSKRPDGERIEFGPVPL